MRCSGWVLAAACGAAGLAATAAAAPVAQEVLAGAPTDLSVTVYRAPYRNAGTLRLEGLGGFALIRETRTVQLPAGLSRVRFEGVADGIEPVSAILTGLADGVVEKNLDARLLSPAALVASAAGKSVTLLRTQRKSGRLERLSGRILTGAQADGVVFETGQGIEALRCSGLPETMTFTAMAGLTASPTLSIEIRTRRPRTQQIQLAYLAYGFDWAADYTATVSSDAKTIDLGAWVTLANGNGVGFPAARTQVVAGRLNRESGAVEPIDAGGPVLARCWPQGRTSDPVELLQVSRAFPLGFGPVQYARATMMAMTSSAAFQEVSVTGSRNVTQEQLGDLKLYRVPQRTTVASRQAKQVRLLDREMIPVQRVFGTQVEDVAVGDTGAWGPASAVLRTRNDAANHLGLPLPSGHVEVFQARPGAPLLLNEVGMRDLAIDEEVEIGLGPSSDVQVRSMLEGRSIDPTRTSTIALVPGVVSLRQSEVDLARRVEVSNARDSSIDFEIILDLRDARRVIRCDQTLTSRNGRPVIRLTIPANTAVNVRYQTEHVQVQRVRP